VAEGEARVIVVVNAARRSWQDGEYGIWTGGGGGSFKQIYCSQVQLAPGGRRRLGHEERHGEGEKGVRARRGRTRRAGFERSWAALVGEVEWC